MKEWRPLRECEFEIDHYTEDYLLYSLQTVPRLFNIEETLLICARVVRQDQT